MTTIRKRISQALVLVLTVGAGGVLWQLDDEQAQTSVGLPQSEIDAYRIHLGLFRGDEGEARRAAEAIERATGVSPAPAFSSSAWCVLVDDAAAAGTAMASAHCFADRTCRGACDGEDDERACVEACPRDATCAAAESTAFDGAATHEDSEGVGYRCASWQSTPSLRARLAAVRPALGAYVAEGEQAAAVEAAGLTPVDSEARDAGP